MHIALHLLDKFLRNHKGQFTAHGLHLHYIIFDQKHNWQQACG